MSSIAYGYLSNARVAPARFFFHGTHKLLRPSFTILLDNVSCSHLALFIAGFP